MASTTHIVVLGGGPAAHRFTEAMTQRAPHGVTLTVVTEEPHHPYDRVALTKALLAPDADLTLADHVWDHPTVTLRTGVRAESIDVNHRQVVLSDGSVCQYDELVLATGSNAATLPIPGAEHSLVYRTLDDVWTIHRDITRFRDEGITPRVVTIGGGLLGLEAAAGARTLGAQAHVIDGGRWLMSNQLDEGAGQALGRLIAENDITVHSGVYPQAVTTTTHATGTHHVTGIDMADGSHIPADIVITAIGIRPRDELARHTNHTTAHEVFALGERGGIVVDATCHTTAPHVWAIGEVACVDGRCVGLVAPANAMAEIVADQLAGGTATFDGFDTATKLKLSGVDVASFGDAFATTPGALEVVYADPARGVYQKIVVSGDATTLLGESSSVTQNPTPSCAHSSAVNCPPNQAPTSPQPAAQTSPTPNYQTMPSSAPATTSPQAQSEMPSADAEPAPDRTPSANSPPSKPAPKQEPNAVPASPC